MVSALDLLTHTHHSASVSCP